MNTRQKSIIGMISLVAVLLAAVIFATPALADTDGTELKITEQPDKLVLEFGPDWAGAQFELKLDSGTFPIPVVVSDSGTLSMDLGGSKTYTLRLSSAPDKADSSAYPQELSEQAFNLNSSEASDEQIRPPDTKPHDNSIPVLHLVLFIGGSLAAVGALVAMRILKKRRERLFNDEYEYDDDE